MCIHVERVNHIFHANTLVSTQARSLPAVHSVDGMVMDTLAFVIYPVHF